MQESYGEGVANHTGPELCVASREAGDEVLVGVRAGEVLSPENTATGVPTLSREAEGHTLVIGNREITEDPTGSETLSMHGSTTRANREIPGSPVTKNRAGRSGKSEDARR